MSEELDAEQRWSRDMVQWAAFACVCHYPKSRGLFEPQWFRDEDMRSSAEKFAALTDETPDDEVGGLSRQDYALARESLACLPAEKNAPVAARRLNAHWLDRLFEERARGLTK